MRIATPWVLSNSQVFPETWVDQKTLRARVAELAQGYQETEGLLRELRRLSMATTDGDLIAWRVILNSYVTRVRNLPFLPAFRCHPCAYIPLHRLSLEFYDDIPSIHTVAKLDGLLRHVLDARCDLLRLRDALHGKK